MLLTVFLVGLAIVAGPTLVAVLWKRYPAFGFFWGVTLLFSPIFLFLGYLSHKADPASTGFELQSLSYLLYLAIVFSIRRRYLNKKQATLLVQKQAVQEAQRRAILEQQVIDEEYKGKIREQRRAQANH